MNNKAYAIRACMTNFEFCGLTSNDLAALARDGNHCKIELQIVTLSLKVNS